MFRTPKNQNDRSAEVTRYFRAINRSRKMQRVMDISIPAAWPPTVLRTPKANCFSWCCFCCLGIGPWARSFKKSARLLNLISDKAPPAAWDSSKVACAQNWSAPRGAHNHPGRELRNEHEVYGLRIRPTPILFPTNIRHTLLDNTFCIYDARVLTTSEISLLWSSCL